uniref:Uncharacterized protein n=1 Tax=Arundo donax TaxID=35708 RepID=A0A0A9H789_ARUDO
MLGWTNSKLGNILHTYALSNYACMEQQFVIIRTPKMGGTCANARGLPVHYFIAE